MIRILQVVNIMDRAGIENMLMNYYRRIDKSKIQFDFLTHRDKKGAYDDEIVSLGGKIYYAPRLYPQNYTKYLKYMAEFFENHKEYIIVHSHIDSMSYMPLLAAKRAGVPIRIAHSHSTSIDYDYKWILKQFFRNNICSVANYYAACSQKAGEYLFGKRNVEIIYNAIDIKRFSFNEMIREQKRKELSINDKYVIGHVGRFTNAKNHFFIIKVFEKVLSKNKNCVLLLVGTGELKDKVEKYVRDNGLVEHVLILSNRDDVNDLYQTMDVFVFPSKYEGLGMGAVEAQISGLNTIVSTNVPPEVKISSDITFLPLEIDKWVQAVMSLEMNKERKTNSNDEYDIEKAAKKLSKYYLSLMDRIS